MKYYKGMNNFVRYYLEIYLNYLGMITYNTVNVTHTISHGHYASNDTKIVCLKPTFS